MSRTKTIYFLSAIVLIIGCYALNLSYSLFVQTEEHNLLSTSVPTLAYSLETSTYTIPAKNRELIKLKVINSGSSDINFGISTESADGITIQLVEKEDNNIVGTLSVSNNKEIWIYVTNSNTTDTEVTFTLTANYSTINFDENFIDNSNIDCINKVKLLNETIIASAEEAVTNNDATRTPFNDNYDLNNITEGTFETDKMLALAEDDYGTSYVYRGNIVDNYVKFAGFTWRIVRINGDGTIRIILDNSIDEVKRDGLNDYAGELDYFNDYSNNNAYVGYMYGDDDSNSYEGTHDNLYNSNMKNVIDGFYENYLENDDNNYYYQNYLADSIFCGDKTLASTSIGNDNTGLGYGMGKSKITFYGAAERLFYNKQENIRNTLMPTLHCAEDEVYDYSRYTKEVQDINGVETNGDLTYPIALLSADELVMAGSFPKEGNDYYYSVYLYNTSDMWTMTPFSFDSDGTNSYGAYIIGFSTSNSSDFNSNLTFFTVKNNSNRAIRPVINLIKNIVIENGDGTETNPYVILTYDNID